ncbi:asparagine synthase (glutamine-hydrolyzing) [Devosia sp. CAU 1758]
MADALAHRGPDQNGVWRHIHPAHKIGLAHRRLSIRDLSTAGRQPMVSQWGNWVITFNGEIYNDGPMAQALAAEHGVEMRTSCDTEVLIEALACRGPVAIRDLNGIFAFGAYDTARGELLLARDAFGVKPLYLWRAPDGKRLAFASEVKSFLAIPGFGRRIDPHALATLLAQGYVGPESSLMADVVSIAPGQVLRIGPDGEASELFRVSTSLKAGTPGQQVTIDDAAAWLRPHFEAAVLRQRSSDVPLAVWQSGGVDSSLVNAACGAPRPRALTVGSSNASFDESGPARVISDLLGSSLDVIQLDTDADEAPASDVFADLVWHMDGELADSSALAVKRLSAATKRHATVVLSGDGADELFGGYATYAATRLASRVGHIVPGGPARAAARLLLAQSASGASRYPKLEWVARFLQGLPQGHLAHSEWRRYAMPWDMEGLLGSTGGDPLLDYRMAIADARGLDKAGDPASWGQAADLSYYLPGDMLMKVDRMSMAHGVEARVPFLDLEFVGQLQGMASALRLPSHGETKPLLRRMLASYGLPPEIVKRKKTGFNVPLASELRGRYRTALTDLLIEGSYVEPYLSADYTRNLAREHLVGSGNHAYLLWTLMTFAQWRKHLGP